METTESAVWKNDEVGRLLEAFADAFGSSDGTVVVRAPGRVNLIGDHTDYNDGFVLPMTIDRDVYVAARARSDRKVRIRSVNFDDYVEYWLDGRPSAGTWASYVTGAVEKLRSRRKLEDGFEMAVFGNVPLGAGLSSSAALEVGVVFALQELFGFALDPIDSVRLCQEVEHRYAGVQCGIMDQFASRLGRRDHALFLDCRNLRHEHVPLALADSGLALVIVDSRVSRELASSAYGTRRAECDRMVSMLRQVDPEIRALRDASIELLDRVADTTDPTLLRRGRHVVTENERVLKARAALRSGEFSDFGRLMNESHESLRDLYEVSTPELDLLTATAQSSPGVLGARMTGGGFGGCTVNLVDRDSVTALRSRLEQAYRSSFDREPGVYVLRRNHQTARLNPA